MTFVRHDHEDLLITAKFGDQRCCGKKTGRRAWTRKIRSKRYDQVVLLYFTSQHDRINEIIARYKNTTVMVYHPLCESTPYSNSLQREAIYVPSIFLSSVVPLRHILFSSYQAVRIIQNFQQKICYSYIPSHITYLWY